MNELLTSSYSIVIIVNEKTLCSDNLGPKKEVRREPALSEYILCV